MQQVHPTDILTGITHNDIEKFSRSLNNITVNEPIGTVTPLWVAITGAIGLNRLTQRMGKGKYEFVEMLLKFGANPSKQCLLIPPICLASYECQPKFVVLLLRHKANPNEYAICKVIKPDPLQNNVCICKLPIDYGIEECDYDCVEILIKFGAIFNKYMIDRAKRIMQIYKKKAKNSRYMMEKYRNSCMVVKLLEKSWTEEIEETALTFMKNNSTKGKMPIRFVGLTD